jgi:hypothetical protein
MKQALLLTLLFAVGSWAFAKDPGSLDLYLLVGQSNMAGRGKVSPADRQSDPRVLVLNKENIWVSRGEPIHFDKPEAAGVGPGFTFAKLVTARNPGVTAGLIPCAVGGTPIARWKPGADLYEQTLIRARIAMKNGTLKAILWHQGEAESSDETKARAYARDLAEVAEGFRRDLAAPSVPFIAGELGEFLYTRKGKKSPYARIVNEQINKLPTLITNAAAVSAKGLGHRGDELHFSSEAQKEFGRRYFDALQSLQSETPQATKR